MEESGRIFCNFGLLTISNVKRRGHEKAKHTMGQKTFLDANLNWDWVQNQLTGEIPRLIYWDERPGSRWPATETVHALRNGVAAMKSNPIGAAADFDEDEF
ncbi:hypothetical protein C5167_008647 [Papaver somniferum]|uniref:Uncharacterized protein n=1 Tax=Papaver somniferum TaxID=3469 RepID=A0A4Y7JW84_PAPSO|nr:hypothetical protein C5167_008647 [Papaver somniferum]